jgi:hypothetical protein
MQTGDGGYTLAGYTESFGAGIADFWLVKTDTNGTVQWDKTYGGTNRDVAFALVGTGDGGYALAGGTYSFGGYCDFWLVKTDSLGNMQWNKTYGGAGYDEAYALVQTGDGGYALAGYTESFGADPRACWLAKTDAFGVVPELPSSMIFAAFMVAATLTVILTKRKHQTRVTQGS